jgi:hypothetical protein
MPVNIINHETMGFEDKTGFDLICLPSKNEVALLSMNIFSFIFFDFSNVNGRLSL